MRLRALKLIALACLIAPTSGCRTTTDTELVRRPSVRKDPCAERLHNICGHLLLHYSTHRKLPPTLEGLHHTSGLPLPPLVCPVSEKPYVYDPDGVPIPNFPGRLVVYDPEPTHSGMRWGILVGASAGAPNITVRVILVPEKDLGGASR